MLRETMWRAIIRRPSSVVAAHHPVRLVHPCWGVRSFCVGDQLVSQKSKDDVRLFMCFFWLPIIAGPVA